MYKVPEDELIETIESISGRERVTLAEDPESGFKCTVSKYQYGIVFRVSEGHDEVIRETTNNSDECLEIYNFILSSFFSSGFSEEDEARIDEIIYATYDMMETLLETSPDDMGMDEGFLESVAFDIEDILYEKYGFATDHPVMSKDGKVISNRFISEV